MWLQILKMTMRRSWLYTSVCLLSFPDDYNPKITSHSLCGSLCCKGLPFLFDHKILQIFEMLLPLNAKKHYGLEEFSILQCGCCILSTGKSNGHLLFRVLHVGLKRRQMLSFKELLPEFLKFCEWMVNIETAKYFLSKVKRQKFMFA